MKNQVLYFLFATLFIFALSGCDKCKDLNCENGGTCVDGECQCPSNYSGENCETFVPCLNVTCNNGGACDPATGECVCAQGYEGPTCSEISANKYVGGYNVTDDCNPGQAYNCAIVADPSEVTHLVFSNLGDYNISDFYGVVDAPLTNETTLTFTIPSQTQSGFTMSGTGSYNPMNGVLTVNYAVTNSGQTFNCEAIFTP